MTSLALLERDGPIATLKLNRPEARNAMSIALLEAMHERVHELESMDDVTVLVITGEGKAFCAGMDLKAVLGDSEAPARLLGLLAELTVRIRRLPMAVVAKVNGAAIGGGCGLTCVCDFCVTHADSKMGFPEVDLGVCPAVVAPWLVRKIGAGAARAILLRGGLMTGAEAHQRGIVTHLVDTRDGLDFGTSELAGTLAKAGPRALRATKSLLNDLDGSLDEELSRRAAGISAEVLATPEAQATLRARLGL
jgi:enoyl-CoA hydratase/carnithine racemase